MIKTLFIVLASIFGFLIVLFVVLSLLLYMAARREVNRRRNGV